MGLTIPKRKRKDVLEKISSYIEDKLANATLEETIFLGSWLAGTFIAFKLLEPTKAIQVRTGGITEMPFHLTGGTIKVPEFGPLLEDPHLLAIAMVASYKFLKSDIGSIGSILSLLK